MGDSIFKKFQNLNIKITFVKIAFLITHDPSKFWVRLGWVKLCIMMYDVSTVYSPFK